MNDPRLTIGAAMRALITSIGGVDAAAATLVARWGEASKGTVSKKLAGKLDWTVADVIALEDAAGRFPISGLFARRVETDTGAAGDAVDLISCAASVAKEAGEAVAVSFTACGSSGELDRAQAVIELDEAISAMIEMRDALDTGSE